MAKEKLKTKAILIGTCVYLLAYLFSVVVLSVLHNFLSFATSNLFLLAPALVTIGYLLAGFVAGYVAKESGAIHGLTVGGIGGTIAIAMLFALYIALNVSGPVGDVYIVLLIMVMQSCIFCCIGGLIGQNHSRNQ